MITDSVLSDIQHNVNTGIEYEIALFFSLLSNKSETAAVYNSIKKRADNQKVEQIIQKTDVSKIINEFSRRHLKIIDCTFETQNDEIGPSDIVIVGKNETNGEIERIGISVKYANTCTLNVTGRRFISDKQIAELKTQLPQYTEMYVKEMKQQYGNAQNWFRKRKQSITTDNYIDLIRDAVLNNWENVSNKQELFAALFHADSPIEYWVYEYMINGHQLITKPQNVPMNEVENIIVKKYQTSYVSFHLQNSMIGKMQIKFNNGFVERCKKQNADLIVDGIEMSYGQPFSSWNFSTM